MIKHVVAFRFREELTELERTSILGRLAAFPAFYPSMRNWTLGPNTSNRNTVMSHAFVVEFHTRAELDDYLTGARHETFVRDVWRPSIENQVIVTLDTDRSSSSDSPSEPHLTSNE